jgi:hypothetical protein
MNVLFVGLLMTYITGKHIALLKKIHAKSVHSVRFTESISFKKCANVVGF